MLLNIVEDPKARLQAMAEPEDGWLWCSECERFFQYRSMVRGRAGRRDACPFGGCAGVGLGFNIFLWDDMREPADSRWPSDPSELKHGRRSPDMEEFYEAQLDARVADLLAAFEDSEERRSLPSDGSPRFARAFLGMMSDLSWDLTESEDAFFDREFAFEVLCDFPGWLRESPVPDPSEIAAELRGMFAFAVRTNCLADADRWQDLLASKELEAALLQVS